MEYFGEEQRNVYRVRFRMDKYLDGVLVRVGEWKIGREGFRKIETATEYAQGYVRRYWRAQGKRSTGMSYWEVSYNIEQQALVKYTDYRDAGEMSLADGEETRRNFRVVGDGVVFMDGFRKIETAERFAEKHTHPGLRIQQQIIVPTVAWTPVTSS